MASEHHISLVWHGLLDAERLSRYYLAVTARQQRWHMGLAAFVVLGSVGVAASLLFGAPDWVAGSLAAPVAAIAVWRYSHGHASYAALTEATAASCSDLTLSWRDLWARLDGLDEEDAWREIHALKHKEALTTARVPSHLAADEHLNVQCAEEAYAVLREEYAAG